MRWLLLLLVLTGVAFLLTPHAAVACPLCRDAVAASTILEGDDGETEEEDGISVGAAYNYSIYLMIAVPYLSLAVVSFLIYRGLKKNADYLRAHGKLVENPLAPPASQC